MSRSSQHAQPEEAPLTTEALRHFGELLRAEREQLLARNRVRVSEALDAPIHLPDEGDEAVNLAAQAFDLRLADKDAKLLRLIDHALAKLARGEYGWCEGTGEPIERARLLVRPWARYSVEYKERLEAQRRLVESPHR